MPIRLDRLHRFQKDPSRSRHIPLQPFQRIDLPDESYAITIKDPKMRGHPCFYQASSRPGKPPYSQPPPKKTIDTSGNFLLKNIRLYVTMSPRLRTIHRQISPWIFALLIISATTGMLYRVGRAWFGMSRPVGDAVMTVHTGSWTGPLGPFYILLVGGGLLALLITGLTMLFRSRAKHGPRAWHRWTAYLLTIPLILTAITGILSGLDGTWYHLPDNVGSLSMSLHQGSWLGKELRPFYILLVGLGLLTLGISGLRLTGLFKKR